MGIPWCIPIVMFSTGRLRIEDRLLEFEARPWRLPFNRLHHLRTDLRLTLTDGDITEVEAFQFASPIMRYYNLPFTRIRTTKGGELAESRTLTTLCDRICMFSLPSRPSTPTC